MTLSHIVDLLIGAILVVGMAFLFGGPPVRAAECARASWYGSESGSRTANGEHFDGSSLTAAHRTLPFGTKLRVTFQGKSVVVRINDRGPYVNGRALDLSKAAARRIGLIRPGGMAACAGHVCSRLLALRQRLSLFIAPLSQLHVSSRG